MKRPLILVGGGGHCKSVIDVAESAGFDILGILDKPDLVGTRVLDYPIIGTDEDIPLYADKVDFIISVGQIESNAVRKRIAARIEETGGNYATLVASDAQVSRFAEIGEGTVVMHRAVVNAGARIGRNTIINTMVNIEHDASVGDFCHISTGTMVNGGTHIGDNCFVGSGAVLYHCISVSEGTIIPAGTIVRKSV